ncbi:MAG TPA: hypothetical protein VFA20_13185 [Myxococcaceae bacterium]|nr:hypothetical protein [Myxococcaceae bacterium]
MTECGEDEGAPGSLQPHPPVRFQYVGRVRLRVRGPVTGRSYEFDHRGATVAVDGRDAPSLLGETSLRVLPSH